MVVCNIEDSLLAHEPQYVGIPHTEPSEHRLRCVPERSRRRRSRGGRRTAAGWMGASYRSVSLLGFGFLPAAAEEKEEGEEEEEEEEEDMVRCRMRVGWLNFAHLRNGLRFAPISGWSDFRKILTKN